MNDNVLNAGFLALLLTVAAAAVASYPDARRNDSVIGALRLPVVTLPTVEMTARRQPATMPDAASPSQRVVQLPAVEMTGRRVPAMAPVTLAAVR